MYSEKIVYLLYLYRYKEKENDTDIIIVKKIPSEIIKVESIKTEVQGRHVAQFSFSH